MEKTAFRTAYEQAHDALNDGLEIIDSIYTEESYEERRELVARLRRTLGQVRKLGQHLCAGDEWEPNNGIR